MKCQILHTVWCMSYFLWGCRGILTMITLRSERVKVSTPSPCPNANPRIVGHLNSRIMWPCDRENREKFILVQYWYFMVHWYCSNIGINWKTIMIVHVRFYYGGGGGGGSQFETGTSIFHGPIESTVPALSWPKQTVKGYGLVRR